MRHHHDEASQLDLFGRPGDDDTVTTPKWQNLPSQTRHRITGLMTRLLVEHGAQSRQDLGEEDGRAPLRIEESGDV